MSLRVTGVGPQVSLQDRGRPGWMHVGVTPSGAADRESHRLANALLGNHADCATLEVLLGGLEVEATAPTWVALAGADCRAEVDGRAVDWATPVPLRAGQCLRLGWAVAGLRAYLAIAGGVEGETVLGSRSHDSLSGLGPAPLRIGDLLHSGPGVFRPSAEFSPTTTPDAGPLTLRSQPGPRAEWASGCLGDHLWTVSADSNRVGVRLVGSPLARDPSRLGRELASEPLVRGAVQLPPSGMPVVFLADHPVTGGYPVIAVLDDLSCDLIAQARPGQDLTFRPATVRR